MIQSIERNTSIIASIVLAAVVLSVVIGILLNSLILPIAASGIITFFGMLIISGYNKKSTKSKGIMRRAIAGSLIVSFMIAFSFLMFQNFQLQTMPDNLNMNPTELETYLLLQNQTASINLTKMNFAYTVFTNFANVIMVVIVFYFGSKGVLQYLEDRKSNQVESGILNFLSGNTLAINIDQSKDKIQTLAKAQKKLDKKPNDEDLKNIVKVAEIDLREDIMGKIKLKRYFVNKNSDIGEQVTIGDDTQINKRVTVGDNTTIGNNVDINKEVKIGSGVTIGDNVSINKDGILENNITIGNNVDINKEVKIGSGVTIGNNVTIEHNVTIERNAIIPSDAVVHEGTTIPEHSIFGKTS